MINAINIPSGVKLKERKETNENQKAEILTEAINRIGFPVCQSCSVHSCARCPLSIKR